MNHKQSKKPRSSKKSTNRESGASWTTRRSRALDKVKKLLFIEERKKLIV
jgi:hypothetical protein